MKRSHFISITCLLSILGSAHAQEKARPALEIIDGQSPSLIEISSLNDLLTHLTLQNNTYERLSIVYTAYSELFDVVFAPPAPNYQDYCKYTESSNSYTIEPFQRCRVNMALIPFNTVFTNQEVEINIGFRGGRFPSDRTLLDIDGGFVGWQETMGPYAGQIKTITSSNDYWFANGYWYADNSFDQWRSVLNGLPQDPSVVSSTFANSANLVFAGLENIDPSSNLGVYKLDASALNNNPAWTAVGTGLPTGDSVTALTTDTNTATNELMIIAGTDGNKIYTANLTSNWSLPDNLSSTINALLTTSVGDTCDTHILFAATQYNKVYKRTCSGGTYTWNTDSVGLSNGSATAFAYDSATHTVYVAIDRQGIYFKEVSAATWTRIGQQISRTFTGLAFTDNGSLVASLNGTYSYYYDATDTTWKPLATGIEGYNGGLTLHGQGNIVALGTDGGGVFSLSTTTPQNEWHWIENNNGLSNASIQQSLTVIQNEEFREKNQTKHLYDFLGNVYTGSSGGGVYKLAGITSWEERRSGLNEFNSWDIRGIACDNKKTDTCYIGTNGTGVWATYDNAFSWSSIPYPTNASPGVRTVLITPWENDHNVFSGNIIRNPYDPNLSGVWLLQNGSWGSNPVLSNVYVRSLASTGRDTPVKYVFAGTDINSMGDGGVYRGSRNPSGNWLFESKGLTSYHVRAVAVANNGDVYAGTADSSNPIWKATSFADNNFVLMNNGFPASQVYSLAIAELISNTNSYVVYAATNNGVFASSDYGQTWTGFNTNLDNTCYAARSLAIQYFSFGYAVWMGTNGCGNFVNYVPYG